MNSEEARRQIAHMVDFIISEAKDRAAEMELKALEDYNVEKLKTLQQMKRDITASIEQRVKLFEIGLRKERSELINNMRLETQHLLYSKLEAVRDTVSDSFSEVRAQAEQYKLLCVKLVLESLLHLRAAEVEVIMSAQDSALLEEVCASAQSKAQHLLAGCGAKFAALQIRPNLATSIEAFMDKPSAGGVIVAEAHAKNVCINTLDARLEHAFQKFMPETRRKLRC